MKLQLQEDNDAGKIYVSKVYNFPTLESVVFFLRMQYTGYFDREWQAEAGKYYVHVGCVLTDIPADHLPDALDDLGITEAQWQEADPRVRATYCINEWGPTFWQATGNNLGQLMKEGRKALAPLEDAATFDAAMKKPQNRAGATGYQWIKGDFEGCGSATMWRNMTSPLSGFAVDLILGTQRSVIVPI